MITIEEAAFNNQDIEENEITSENVTPNSQDEKEESINNERSYLSADDGVTTGEKLAELNQKFSGNYVTTSYIKGWIDFSIVEHSLTIEALREVLAKEALAKDSSIDEINDHLETNKKQAIAAEKNKRLQNYHAALVIEYTKRLRGSNPNKGEKLEPPVAAVKDEINDHLETNKKQAIAAEKNKRLQNYHAALVIEYTKRLRGSNPNKGEKLEPPIAAVKRVSFNI